MINYVKKIFLKKRNKMSFVIDFKKVFLRLGLVAIFFLLAVSFLFHETQKRKISVKVPNPVKEKSVEVASPEYTRGFSKNENNPSSPTKYYTESIIGEFANWIKSYQKLTCSLEDNCTEHDPRKIRHFFKVGEKLARKRKDVLKKLIQTNPEKALSAAIDARIIEGLPSQISTHLESWRHGTANVSSYYKCKGSDHSECVNEK